MSVSAEFMIFSQPAITAPDCVLAEAVITWEMYEGTPTVISRYRHDVWLWPAVGTLSNHTAGSRCIDFHKVQPYWRQLVKQSVFAALRHPRIGSRTPGFYNLRHKSIHLRRLTELAEKLGLRSFSALTKSQIEAFLRNLTSTADHVETVVGQIATMSEMHRMLASGLLQDGISFNVAGVRSAQKLAKALWREIKGKDFVYEHEGYQPFRDEDIEQIMGTAFHYIHRLAKPLIYAHGEVTRIWAENNYSFGKGGGSGARRVSRDVPAMLASLELEEPSVATLSYWPPMTGKDLGVHIRLLQGLCLIIIAFFTLARRSELVALKADNCLGRTDQGEWVLYGRIFKGEDDLQGRPTSWPIPQVVADSVKILKDIRSAVSRRSLSQTGQPINHDSLFTTTSYAFSDSNTDDDVRLRLIEPLSHSAINAITRDIKLFLFPEIEGPIALHRFRKTAARLVALTVEGSSLVLKNILHHDSSRTTLHYMFASPFMQQELALVWPEIAASNLKELYSRRSELVGPGVANLKSNISNTICFSSAQTEPNLGVSEDDFVSLGAEMVEKGHMLLTRLGVGVWCLKPALEQGKCSKNSRDIIPDASRCSVQCHFHIQDARRTKRNLADLANIDAKLGSSELAKPIRALYERYRAELLTIIPTKIISE